ncbi:hypothetical protein [Burkholderia cenocepacia]|uniref:hypothetical protein n=1 Tax=Burkholderia cenocepacia TaxID=95486 RepID=UPI001B9132B3|nr:hypothetical protein [Burkholderia cenocepacia]MBR8427263.1 hypothetical protein [Burkholderia cenocepacia]
MNDAIDKIQFSDDADLDAERDPEDLGRAQSTGGGPAKPHKPFPLMKLMGGIGAVSVVLVVGAVGLVKVLQQPKQSQDQFGSVPQPQMAAGANVQPATQGGIAQIGAPCAPNGLMAQSPTGIVYCQAGVWAQGNVGAVQSAQGQAPLPQGQFPQQTSSNMAPQGTQNSTTSPNAPVTNQFATTQQQVGNDVNPVGPVPHRVGPADAAQPAQTSGATGQQASASTVTADHAPQAASGDVATQLAAMQATIAELQKQLAGKNVRPAAKSAARAKNGTQKAVPVQAASADTAEQDEGETTVAPAPRHDRVARATRHTKKTASSGDKSKPDTSYVVTGMIGTRAFITKKGSNDVNPDSTVSVGDTLDDGRKVLSVDPKTKRVWLSGNQYISTGSAGGDE